MPLNSTNVILAYHNIVAGVPIVVPIPAFSTSDIYVKYGSMKSLSVQGTDYTVALDYPEPQPPPTTQYYQTVTITPTAALIDKINLDGTNIIHVGREMTLTTDFSEIDAFTRSKLDVEFARTNMKLQQLHEGDAASMLPDPRVGNIHDFIRVNSDRNGYEFVVLTGGGDMLRANNLSEVTSKPTALANIGGQPHTAKLDGVSAMTATPGIVVHDGVSTYGKRSIAGGTGITVTNADGVDGNPTVNVASGYYQPIDPTLSSLSALDASTGMVVQTAVDTFVKRSLVAGPGVTISEPAGTTGNPTISVDPTISSAAAANANLIINGCHDISQEYGNNNILTDTGRYTTDQWFVARNTHTAVTYAVRLQDADTPVGFNSYLQVWATVADTSVAPTDVSQVYQPIEGTRWQVLGWGTANALPIAVGFWVWVSAGSTGTYSFSIRNGTTNRSYVHPFTVTTGDTWQYVTFVVPGDTTGTWAKDSAVGAYASVTTMCGTNYQTTADTWVSGDYSAVAGQFNLLGTITRYFLLTGVTILPMPLGTTVSPLSAANSQLLMRDPVQELALCQRYWQRYGGGGYGPMVFGYGVASLQIAHHTLLPYPMRIVPVISVTGTWTANNCAQPTFGSDGKLMYMGVLAVAAGQVSCVPDTSDDLVTLNARM